MKEIIALDKSKAFAIRIVNLYRYLCETEKEYVLSKQLLRSGTSIGANIAEASGATSKKDFLAKVHISFRECSETKYWLEILHESEYLTDAEFQSIYDDCIELRKLLSSITKTTRININNSKEIEE